MKTPVIKPFLFVLLTSIFACLISCDSKKQEPISIAEPTKELTWDWNQYGQASELKLRTMPVDIQPKQSFEIKSEHNGIVTVTLDEKNSAVTEGQIIAQMDLDSIAEKEERLQLQEEKQVLDEMKEETLTIPEARKKAKEELAEAKRKIRLMKLVMNNPAMAEMSQELLGGQIGIVNNLTLKEAEDDLKLAQKKLKWAETFDEKIRKGQLRLQEMDMNKNKRDFQEEKDRSYYKAPFSGELRLEVNFIKGTYEYTIGARETIATLNNYDEIHAHIKVANAEWVALQPERLYVQLKNKEKTLMTFLNDRIDKDPRSRKEERKYVFSIPLKNNENMKRLAGTQMQGDLIYKLPEICYIIPKYDLALYAYGKTTSIEWAGMAKEIWPNAIVIAEGRTEIAIKLK